MANFDPGAPASADDGIFGLPYSEKESALVLLPVPWEVTTSYGGGTSKGPAAILEASAQVDLYDFDVLRPYEPGIFMRPESKQLVAWNKQGKAAAQKAIKAIAAGKKPDPKALKLANELGSKMNGWVYEQTKGLYAAGKLPGLVGGDHSTPYGAIKAAVEKHPGLGLLHFDAHHDTRDAYEGFTWSHASIFFNVMKDLPVAKLTQVGIRDFSEDERAFCKDLGPRCSVFYQGDLARRRFAGKPFDETAREIVDSLPQEVWVTFDIDGLDPRFCPGTGTPVPGGLDFEEANHILRQVALSGRKIVGFDLNEVSPKKGSEWDANVGARLLYKMCAWTLASQGKARVNP
jgi:agmatinase